MSSSTIRPIVISSDSFREPGILNVEIIENLIFTERSAVPLPSPQPSGGSVEDEFNLLSPASRPQSRSLPDFASFGFFRRSLPNSPALSERSIREIKSLPSTPLANRRQTESQQMKFPVTEFSEIIHEIRHEEEKFILYLVAEDQSLVEIAENAPKYFKVNQDVKVSGSSSSNSTEKKYQLRIETTFDHLEDFLQELFTLCSPIGRYLDENL